MTDPTPDVSPDDCPFCRAEAKAKQKVIKPPKRVGERDAQILVPKAIHDRLLAVAAKHGTTPNLVARTTIEKQATDSARRWREHGERFDMKSKLAAPSEIGKDGQKVTVRLSVELASRIDAIRQRDGIPAPTLLRRMLMDWRPGHGKAIRTTRPPKETPE